MPQPELMLQDVAHRRPYEVLMLLRPTRLIPKTYEPQLQAQPQGQSIANTDQQHGHSPKRESTLDVSAQNEQLKTPEGLVMLAVPGEHSRKPKLAQLLQPYLPANPRCLEVS